MIKTKTRALSRSASLLLAGLMLLSAVAHLVTPEAYAPLIPSFLPLLAVNYFTALCEAIVGTMLILPARRVWGAYGFMILMLGFLPLHIWDFIREESFLGSSLAAGIRLFFQFLLIALGFWLGRVHLELQKESRETASPAD